MFMGSQWSNVPPLSIVDVDMDGIYDSTQRDVLEQHSSLTPRLMNNEILSNRTSNESSPSEVSNEPHSAYYLRMHNETSSQGKHFERWLDTKDWYPTAQQKEDLSGESMKRSQIDRRLSRVRQTYLISITAVKGSTRGNSKGLSSNQSGSVHGGRDAHAVDIEVDSIDPSLKLEHHSGSLLEWWFESCLSQIGSHMSKQETAQNIGGNIQSPDQPYVTGSLSSSGDLISPQSVYSNRSGSLSTTVSINYLSGRRRGRRLVPGSRTSRASNDQSGSDGVLYYCTVCNFTSPFCSSWRRHEREQHVQQPPWVCQPSVVDADNVQVCSFCSHDIGSFSCPHQDQTQKCWASNNRDFQRKSQLKEHLMRVHELDKVQADLALLKSQPSVVVDTTAVDLTCYFCGYVETSWNQRAEHVAGHFRSERLTKVDWDIRKAAVMSSRLSQIDI